MSILMQDNFKKHMRFSYMHMCFITDLGIDGCIYSPCVSNELDPYLSEPLFVQNYFIIDAPVGGEIFSTVALIVM